MKNKFSFITLLCLFATIFLARVKMLNDNELSWDVFGYYIYLPATFIHHDILLNDISWIHDIMAQKPISGTLFQVNRGPEGNMFFFLMGMALLYSPFFLLSHLIALITGSPADGFSLPYQYGMALGMTTYTFIGLFYLRKILLHFFNDKSSSIVMILVVLATNYFHFATTKNLETANSLFTLIALIVWNTIQWHQNFNQKNLLGIGAGIAIITLIKPTEIFSALIPVLWGVYNRQTLIDKINKVIEHRKQFYYTIGLGILIWLPQMLYWQIEKGKPIVDSYYNPGIGLDVFNPHILQVIFSYRKGWLLYTPIMIFALLGFIFLYRKNKKVFVPTFVYFILSLWLISSWTEWWYGASFSIRPLITTYAVLSIPLGLCIQKIIYSGILVRVLITPILIFFIALNLFQIWQLNHYIIDPYRTTKDYYWAIFGKTSIDPETKYKLSIERSFSGGEQKFTNEIFYNRRNIGWYDFSDRDTNLYNYYITDTVDKNVYLKLDSTNNFSPNIRTTYSGITTKDHAWIRAKVRIFIPEGYKEELPALVMSFERKEGSYAYRSAFLDVNTLKYNQWNELTMDYLTPEVRSINDIFKAYVWHRGKSPVHIDDLKVDAFEIKW